MKILIQATFEDGVFKPDTPPSLHDHERVRLTVEKTAANLHAELKQFDQRRRQRIRLDPELAREVAVSHAFNPEES